VKRALASGADFSTAPILSATSFTTLATVRNVRAEASEVDPNVTFLAFLTAIEENDVLGAQDAASYLATWLGNGGFEPNWLPEEKDAFLMFAATVDVYAN
jgi:hypothetical protein